MSDDIIRAHVAALLCETAAALSRMRAAEAEYLNLERQLDLMISAIYSKEDRKLLRIPDWQRICAEWARLPVRSE